MLTLVAATCWAEPNPSSKAGHPDPWFSGGPDNLSRTTHTQRKPSTQGVPRWSACHTVATATRTSQGKIVARVRGVASRGRCEEQCLHRWAAQPTATGALVAQSVGRCARLLGQTPALHRPRGHPLPTTWPTNLSMGPNKDPQMGRHVTFDCKHVCPLITLVSTADWECAARRPGRAHNRIIGRRVRSRGKQISFIAVEKEQEALGTGQSLKTAEGGRRSSRHPRQCMAKATIRHAQHPQQETMLPLGGHSLHECSVGLPMDPPTPVEQRKELPRHGTRTKHKRCPCTTPHGPHPNLL